MKKNVIRLSIALFVLCFSTAMFSAVSSQSCKATAFCFDGGVQYGLVACVGEIQCLTFYEKVYCDGDVSQCIDPPPPK